MEISEFHQGVFTIIRQKPTSSEAKYRIKLATSSAVQNRPNFCRALKSFKACSGSALVAILSLNEGVSTVPEKEHSA